MKKVLFLFSFIAILFIVTGCESKDEKKFYGCDDCVFARYTETKKIGLASFADCKRLPVLLSPTISE